MARHVGNNREFAQWLSPFDSERSRKLNDCATWLLFRQALGHPGNPAPKLAAGYFCQQPLLCAFCAAGRAARHVQALAAKLAHVMRLGPSLVPYFVTLTAESQDDLRAMQKHVWAAWGQLMQKRRNTLKGKSSSVTGLWDGGFVSGEAKRGKGGHGWHYHLHGIVLAPGGKYAPMREAMTREWATCLGQTWASTTFQPVKSFEPGESSSVIPGVIEACKYSVKFEAGANEDRWEAAQALRRVRNLRPFGSLYGVKLPDEVTDDLSSIEGYPYIELAYRFLNGGYIGEALDDARESAFDEWNQEGEPCTAT